MTLWKNWCKNRVCITKLQKLFFSGTEYISSENKLHGSGLFLDHYFLIRLVTIGWKQRTEKRYMVLETMWFEETSSNEIVVIFNSGLNRECFPHSVQSLSHLQLFAIPWTTACQASLSITNSRSLLKLMSIASVMPSNHLILCCPVFLLPSISPSIRVFSNESILHIRWPKYWNFSFSTTTSNERSGLISFNMDWLVGSPCTPRESQESSATRQFKSINSSAISFLYSPTLTSIHDYWKNHSFDSVQFTSVAQLCLTLCDPMNCSMPGLPVHQVLLEFTKTHAHWVSDAIQPSHPLLSRSPPALYLSQHQDLFKWVSSSHQVAKVLEFQLQHQSFQWTPRTDLL